MLNFRLSKDILFVVGERGIELKYEKVCKKGRNYRYDMTADRYGQIKFMTSKIILVLLLVTLGAAAAFAQSPRSNRTSKGARLITALAHSKTVPGNFGDDGLFIGDVSPDVLSIIKLGRNAIPLLIRHLDDRRVFTHMEFCCEGTSGPQKVTVGQGVLDILITIIRKNAPMFDLQCLKEGSDGKCVASRYESGKRGKQNWLRAYRAGKIHYQ